MGSDSEQNGRNKRAFHPAPHSLNLDQIRLIAARSLAMIGAVSKYDSKGAAVLKEAVHVLTDLSSIPHMINKADLKMLITNYTTEWEKYLPVKKISHLAKQTVYSEAERALKREVIKVNEEKFDYFFGAKGVNKTLDKTEHILNDFTSESLKLLYVHSLSLRGNIDLIGKLSTILNYQPKNVQNQLEKKEFVVFGKHLTDEQVKRIHALKHPGMFVETKEDQAISLLWDDQQKEWSLYKKIGIFQHVDEVMNRFLVNTKWPEELELEKDGKFLRYYPFLSDAITDSRKLAMPELTMDQIMNLDMLYEYIRTLGTLEVDKQVYYPKDIIIAVDDALHQRVAMKNSPLFHLKGTSYKHLWQKVGEFIVAADGNEKKPVSKQRPNLTEHIVLDKEMEKEEDLPPLESILLSDDIDEDLINNLRL